jgi:hypothetical protein
VIGDQAAVALADAISQNSSLKSLKWDDNSISLEGWQAVSNAMQSNRSLIRIEYPEKDVRRVLATAASKERGRTIETINECFSSISKYLKENEIRMKNEKNVQSMTSPNTHGSKEKKQKKKLSNSKEDE